MKRSIRYWTGVVLLMISWQASAQIITTEPAIPVAEQPVTIYFDATQGTGGLEDFSGDVYAHTGVLTDESSGDTDWKYVKTEWGENTANTKLTRVSDNLYSLEITPSIRDYYGVPGTEVITHMAFVFRSADASVEGKDEGGKDIFVEVFEEGLNVSISLPAKNLVTDPGTDISLEAAASESATLELYLNDTPVKSVDGTSITHTFNFADAGDYWIKVTATGPEESDADSVFVHAKGAPVSEAVPVAAGDGINYVDESTVTLVLYAPGKESAFVIGDFNDWTPRTDARMKEDGDRFWITLTGLTPGMEYAYQYLLDEELTVADPYTDKILDPSNDRWISNATYPDLKPYPSGYASGIVSVLQTDQDPYVWQTTDFTPPPKENLVIYELLVRDFLEAHDWKTLADTLDYLDNLGINAIELMPFNEFEGNESWGYNPSFYFAPDKYYGPKNDLKAFIDACHARGIAVIMDMVLNHSYSQSPLVQMYFNDATGKVTAENPWYNVESPNQTYSWGYDFDHESQATKDLVDSVNSYWLTEYRVDGYRFDFTKGFTNTPGDGWAYDAARISILTRMTDQIRNVNQDAYVILEHLADNAEEKVLSDYGMMLWGNMNHAYNEATMGYHDGGKSNFSGISYKSRGWDDPHLVGYMESHDEERLMFKNLEYGNAGPGYDITRLWKALERLELAGAFFFTVPGPKMIWQFGELGYDYSINYECRVCNKPIRWDYFENGKRQRIYQKWSAMIRLRREEPAFRTADFALSLDGAGKRIELNHESMDVRIIGNFGVEAREVYPDFSKTGTWYDYFSGEALEVTDLNEMIMLEPGQFRIYTTKELETPEITVGEDPVEVLKGSGSRVFPVPASGPLHVESDSELQSLVFFDLRGRVVHREQASGRQHHTDISFLEPGFYLVRLDTEGRTPEVVKILKQH